MNSHLCGPPHGAPCTASGTQTEKIPGTAASAAAPGPSKVLTNDCTADAAASSPLAALLATAAPKLTVHALRRRASYAGIRRVADGRRIHRADRAALLEVLGMVDPPAQPQVLLAGADVALLEGLAEVIRDAGPTIRQASQLLAAVEGLHLVADLLQQQADLLRLEEVR